MRRASRTLGTGCTLLAAVVLLGHVGPPASGQSLPWRDAAPPGACPPPWLPPSAVAPPAGRPAPTEPQAPAAAPAPSAPSPPAVSPPDTAPAASPSTSAEGGATVSLFDSVVGYIDNAIPGNEVRLRFDSAYRSNRPNRAEFFYARPAPFGPGLPLPETRVDYQEPSAYLELLVAPRASLFVETPYRFLNPEVNADHQGFGDLNTGFKYAFFYDSDTVASFQLRLYAPTGDEGRGLGTGHTSLEPAILGNRRLVDRLTVAGELRYWVPLAGTDFAGDVLRYGVGLSYGEPCPNAWWVTPVVEVVGWTVLSGKETVVASPTPAAVKDAAGDTIVNAKLGARVGWGERADVYAGYGRPLTGAVWYKDIWRLELRWHF